MSTHSFKPLTLALLLLLLWCPLITALPWLITEAKQEITETFIQGYYNTITVTTTSIEAIIPTATSIPEALSTVTQVNTLFEITAVAKLYPSAIGTAANYAEDEVYGYGNGNGGIQDASERHTTIFVVDLTYTAPTGCDSSWTTTTAATIIPPDVTVRALLPRTKTSVSLSVDTSIAFRETTYTHDYVWVNPTQIPDSSMDSLRDENYPTSLYTGGGNCYYTPAASTGGNSYYYGSGYYNNYNDYDDRDWFEYYYGISLLGLILAPTLSWIGFWFLMGILESWIRFRRLMLGWQTRRGLPVCWSLTILPISLCCLFGFRKGFRARSAADAVILKERWEKMSGWRKFRLFLAWGFRYEYPVVLGPPPPRVKVSKRPGGEPLLMGQSLVPMSMPMGVPVPGGQGIPQVPGQGQGQGQQMQMQGQVPGQMQGQGLGQGSDVLKPMPRAYVPEASGALDESTTSANEEGRARSV